jgi:hypothetical protein
MEISMHLIVTNNKVLEAHLPANMLVEGQLHVYGFNLEENVIFHHLDEDPNFKGTEDLEEIQGYILSTDMEDENEERCNDQ